MLDVRQKCSAAGYGVDAQRHAQHRQARLELAREASRRVGAGEIVVNSIDHDGLMKGYDLALARSGTRRDRACR